MRRASGREASPDPKPQVGGVLEAPGGVVGCSQTSQACALTLWPQALSPGCLSPSLLSCPWGYRGPGAPSFRRHSLKARTRGCVPGPCAPQSVPAWAELQGLWGQAQRATPPVVLLTCLFGPWPLVLASGSCPPRGSSVLAPCLCLQASLSLTDHFSALPGVSGIHSNSERCLHPARVSSEGRTGGQDTLTLLPLSIWSVFFLHGNHQGPSDPAPACPTL